MWLHAGQPNPLPPPPGPCAEYTLTPTYGAETHYRAEFLPGGPGFFRVRVNFKLLEGSPINAVLHLTALGNARLLKPGDSVLVEWDGRRYYVS
jgi:hypothetical protein